MLPQSALADVVNEVSDAVVGMGPIEFLLKDPEVTEVMVNGADDVYVERKGRIERVADRLFEGEEAVLHVIERIVAPLGLRVDASSPWVDARLPDGSRVHAIVPPLSLCGPVLNVRKFSSVPFAPERSARRRDARAADARVPRGVRSRTSEHRDLGRHELGQDDAARRAVVVRPGRTSGSITIEDAAELRLAAAPRDRPRGPAGRTSRVAARSRSGTWFATRSGCDRIGSSSERFAAARPSTCSRR